MPGVGGVVDFLVHTPPGSPAFLLAESFLAAVTESGADDRSWRLVERGADPGVEAMTALVGNAGNPDMIATATPVIIQNPLLRNLDLTHRDLTPLSRLVGDRYLLVVRSHSRFATAEDFLAGIREKPTRTAGYFVGGINHLLGLAIAEKTGAEIAFVLVDTEPEIFAALAAGEIDWAVGVPAETLPRIRSGDFRALAVLDSERIAGLPDLATLAEAGTNVMFRLWRGLIGPPGLTADQTAHWLAVVAAARQTDSWRAYLADNVQTDDPLDGPAFGTFLETEWDWYAKHLGLAGLIPGSRDSG